jgi:hypothetical protein
LADLIFLQAVEASLILWHPFPKLLLQPFLQEEEAFYLLYFLPFVQEAAVNSY